jgi:glycerol-3-phosphate acyltransferase PlsY
MTLWLPILTLAYLLGSIPFGYLLVRFFRQQDIRVTGSGNIGATNVARSGGKGLGILTLALDLAKGLAAVLIARHFAPFLSGHPSAIPSTLAVTAGVLAVAGHVFPIWLGFRGGKGVATALGVFLGIAPWAALASLTVFILLVLTTRLVSLASIAAAALIPLFALLTVPDRAPAFVGGVMFIALLVILKHRANMVRLLRGQESRFGAKKAPRNPGGPRRGGPQGNGRQGKGRQRKGRQRKGPSRGGPNKVNA